MAGRRLVNPPDPLQLSKGNFSQNWKRFKQKWTNYELATGIFRKEDQVLVATFLTVIGFGTKSMKDICFSVESKRAASLSISMVQS